MGIKLLSSLSKTDHAGLQNLVYASSGHTGFAPSDNPTFTTAITSPLYNSVAISRGGVVDYSSTYIGGLAASSTGTSKGNTSLGYNALTVVTSGSSATAVGSNALSALTTGFYNTAVGESSQLNCTTGGYNTTVGRGTMVNNTTGANNIAIGYNALYTSNGNGAISESTANVAIGYGAMDAATSSSYCTCIGTDAGGAITTGVSHVAVGNNALAAITTASTCTAVGAFALGSTTAIGNTGIGFDALADNTTGTYNTALGDHAGYNAGVALQTMSHCVFIGDSANSTANAITNAIAIGYQAVVSASNQISIGNTSHTALILNGLTNASAPASAGATGIKGEVRVTSTYIYVCIAANTWVRAAIATW